MKKIVGKPGYAFSGKSRTEYFEPRHVDPFIKTMKEDFTHNGLPLTCDRCAPTDKAHQQGWCAAETLVRCWTSTIHCRPLQREWCSLLQAGIRLNDPDLSPIITSIWATMNVYCVANRAQGVSARIIAWPGPLEGEEKLVLHRGGRLHEAALQWWETACLHYDTFRVPGAVAVSKLASKAFTFMHHLSYPDSAPKVYFRFHLEQLRDSPCDHAVCLDAISVLPDEQEFLFPPFSSFQAVSKTWCGSEEEGFWVIIIRVFKNNLTVSEDIPLCPWI